MSDQNPETPEIQSDPLEDLNLGAEAVKQAAEYSKENPELVEKLASLAYAARTETLQNFFDSMTDENQADLIRADERTWLGQWMEKYNPSLDWKQINVPRNALRTFFHTLAICGVIDVKPEMEAKMRSLPGTGIFDIPYVSEIVSLVGAPELAPFLEAGKMAKDASSEVSQQVRDRVREYVQEHANDVPNTQKEEHHKAAEATPEDVVSDKDDTQFEA